MTKTATCLGVFIMMFISVAVVVFLNGWAVATLWRWFIVPHFGVSEISYSTAFGFCLILSLASDSKGDTIGKKDDREDLFPFSTTIMLCLRPILSVGLGWIVLHLMG